MDKFYRKRYKILGGPGCGKTTRVMRTLGNYFKQGLLPSQVLMIGFAKATVETLKERAMKELNFSSKQAESIKTIHKYCRDKLGQQYDVFNSAAKTSFLKKLKTDPDNWVMLDTEKDKTDQEFAVWDDHTSEKFRLIFQIVGHARHDAIMVSKRYLKKKALDKILEFHASYENFKFSKIQKHEIAYCYKNFVKFKKSNNMIDFEDMLEKALASNIIFPDYKVVMVDEVQDLTPLEWRVIAKLGLTTEELYLVGDDDQAIYGWKGANVKIFQKWSCDESRKIILPKTHRLPVKIYNLAQQIADNITHRIGNKYEPCKVNCHGKDNQEGIIQPLFEMDELDEIIDVDSSAIMCARGWAQCHQYVRYLKDRGIIWKEKSKTLENMGSLKSSFPETPRKILKSWDALKKGVGLNGKEVRNVIEFFKPGLVQRGKKTALITPDLCPEEFHNPDNRFTFTDLKEKYFILADIHKPWFDVFNFTTSRKKEKKKPNALFDDDLDFNNYLKTCYDRDPTLSKADIIVATIHGVKGMERKKVILCSNWGFSYHNYYSGLVSKEDEELRICYVGVTRAQEELYILRNGYRKNFPYLML